MLLIDADILIYRIGHTCQTKTPEGEVVALPEGIACARMRESLINIHESLNNEPSRIFLSSTDHSNYRYSFYPEYKANRTAAKPLLYTSLRAFLFDNGAEEVFGQEADDKIGIEATRSSSIIVTIDKDLDQIPGMHYNFVKGLLYNVTPEEGLKFFYHQLLMGDAADNIPGLTGIGPKKAEKALARATTERHFFQIARTMYEKEYAHMWYDIMLRNGRLLKIRQFEDEMWDLPEETEVTENEVA